MRRIADLCPGSAKTDARGAAIIVGPARATPRTLRDIRVDDEQIVQLAMLAGFDEDVGRADHCGLEPVAWVAQPNSPRSEVNTRT